MSKSEVPFESEEMTRDECVAAVNFSALHIQVAVTKMTAFVIAYLGDEPELVETARRVDKEMNVLCKLIGAMHPGPWIVVDEGNVIG